MKTVTPQSTVGNAPLPVEDGEPPNANEHKPKFWRYPSEALDRYGDWLLENLPAMRAETINREEA